MGTVKQARRDVRFSDPILDDLSHAQKELRLKIANTKTRSKVKKLKAEINKIIHEISKRTTMLAAKELDEIVGEIESAKDSAHLFKAVRTLCRLKHKGIIVMENEKVISRADKAAELIAKHFESKLFDDSKEPNIIPETQGSLQIPIDPIEVELATKKLQNGRAAGPGNIAGELFKYGPPELHE